MAHKKGQSSSKNGRESNAQRLGVKRFGGEKVTRRQHPGSPARHQDLPRASTWARAKDDTLFALVDGEVKFTRYRGTRKKVHVVPRAARDELSRRSTRAPRRLGLRLRRRGVSV